MTGRTFRIIDCAEEVRGKDLHPHAGELPQLLCDGLQTRPIAGDEDEIMVGLRQLPGQLQTDAGGGPGNKCGSHNGQGSASGADRRPGSAIPLGPDDPERWPALTFRRSASQPPAANRRNDAVLQIARDRRAL